MQPPTSPPAHSDLGKEIEFDFYLPSLPHVSDVLFQLPRAILAERLQQSPPSRVENPYGRGHVRIKKISASPLEVIRGYQPKRNSDWDEIKRRVCFVRDDGHAAKVVRAIAHGREVCRPYQSSDTYRLKDNDWHQLALMAIDSIEGVAGEISMLKCDSTVRERLG